MGILGNLSGRKPEAESEASVEGFWILYDRDAYLQAPRANLWQIAETGVSVCSVERVRPASPYGGDGAHDLAPLILRILNQLSGELQEISTMTIFGLSQTHSAAAQNSVTPDRRINLRRVPGASSL